VFGVERSARLCAGGAGGAGGSEAAPLEAAPPASAGPGERSARPCVVGDGCGAEAGPPGAGLAADVVLVAGVGLGGGVGAGDDPAAASPAADAAPAAEAAEAAPAAEAVSAGVAAPVAGTLPGVVASDRVEGGAGGVAAGGGVVAVGAWKVRAERPIWMRSPSVRGVGAARRRPLRAVPLRDSSTRVHVVPVRFSRAWMREIWSSDGSLMSAFEPRPMVIVSPSAGSVQRCEPSDTANSVSTNTPPGSRPVCAILPARPTPGPERPAPMSLVTPQTSPHSPPEPAAVVGGNAPTRPLPRTTAVAGQCAAGKLRLGRVVTGAWVRRGSGEWATGYSGCERWCWCEGGGGGV
jgi:hypothetical protein